VVLVVLVLVLSQFQSKVLPLLVFATTVMLARL
jgi:hypothetical protein